MKHMINTLCALCLLGSVCLPTASKADEDVLVQDIAIKPNEGGGVLLEIDKHINISSLPAGGDRVIQRSFDLVHWEEIGRYPSDLLVKTYVDEEGLRGDKPAYYRLLIDQSIEDSNEILVQFTPGVTEQAYSELVEGNQLGTPLQIIHTPLMKKTGEGPIIRFRPECDAADVCERLDSSSLVMSVSPNMEPKILETANDPYVNERDLWGMATSEFGTRADLAWAQGYTGSDEVIIAVLDTGIDFNHPDLKDNIWVNPNEIPNNNIDDDGNGYIDDVSGWDFHNDDANPFDDNGHGTHVAGTIGAKGGNHIGVAGVNWNVKILPLKILGAEGSSALPPRAAIDYVTDLKQRGANIVAMNNSWGYNFCATSEPERYFSSERASITHAANAGVAFVAAAGNSGMDSDACAFFPSSHNTTWDNYWSGPASYDSVVAVASHTKEGEKSYFSNYGKERVDLSAPGSSILSTIPGNEYRAFSGTSMATPHVAGALGLYHSVYQADAQDMIEILLSTTAPTPSQQGLTVTEGRLDIPTLVNQPPSQQNRNPIAGNDAGIFTGRNSVTIPVLANDSDRDDDTLTVSSFTQGSHGSVSRNTADGTQLVYKPESRTVAKDSFVYTISDGNGGTASGVVTLNNTDYVDLPPIAMDDHITVRSGEEIELTPLLWNDRDPNGKRLSLFDVGWSWPDGSDPTNGVIVQSWQRKGFADVYIPNPGFTGTDSFTYRISDGTYRDMATVYVTVLDEGSAPRKPPKLKRPLHKRENVRPRPTFRWERRAGAASYELEIAKGFPGDTLYGYKGITQGKFRIPAEDRLVHNHNYFWRVRSVGANGDVSRWSSFRHFKVRSGGRIDRHAELVSPARGTLTPETSPEFTWSHVEDAASYRIEIAQFASSHDHVIHRGEVGPGMTSFTLPQGTELDEGVSYFWRVIAVNEEGEGTWSPWSSLAVTDPAAHDGIDLVSPSQNATGVLIAPEFKWTDLADEALLSHVLYVYDNEQNNVLTAVCPERNRFKLPAGHELKYDSTYTWRVVSFLNGSIYRTSQTYTFKTAGFFGGAPTLISPVPSETGVNNRPRFEWTAVQGAESYRLQLFRVNMGNKLVHDYRGLNESSFTIPEGTELAGDRAFIWKVAAVSADGRVVWSDEHTFRTALPAPQQLAPSHGAQNMPIDLYFTWLRVSGATSYRLEFSDNPDASGIISSMTRTTSDNNLLVQLNPARTYYWRVTAVGPQSTGSSGWRSVTTQQVAPVEAPNVLSPVNGAVDVRRSPNLDWSSKSRAEWYRIEITRRNSDFKVVYTSVDSEFTVPADLHADRVFEWKVRAENSAGVGPWSAKSEFRTRMTAPQLLLPSEGAANQSRTPTFTWEDVSGAVSYTFEIAADAPSADKVLTRRSVTKQGTQHAITTDDPLRTNRDYYWRVQASGPTVSKWSEWRHFKTHL